MAVKPTCSSVPPRAAVAGAGPFADSWIQAMQSRQATCVDTQRFAGAKKPWPQLTTRGMSQLLERLWEIQKALMGQSLRSFNVQQKGKLLTVTVNIPKLKPGTSCLDRFEDRTLMG